MRRLLIASAALAAFATGALAADLHPPLKAAPPTDEFSGGSGPYWGLGTYGGVASSSVNGTGLLVTNLASNNINAAGGGIDAALGYISGSTATLGFGNWRRCEAEVAYQNIEGASGGNSVASRWAATQECDIGADAFAFITAALGSNFNWPTLTPPSLASISPNIQTGLPKQYFGVIVREFGLDGSVGAAHGVTVGIAPGVKTGFLYPTLGKDGKPNGGAVDLWASVTWNTRGATLGNVFAANGAPLTFNAGVNQGTTYLVGIRYDLAFGR